jgi:CDP-diacylglycerol---serine O-phosphatidyltransferase
LKTIISQIPNALTCGNLLSGCVAILFMFSGRLEAACYMVGIAAIFDFLDGFAARMLKVTSAIGKDLDSLADMVTFGVVPGLVLYHLIRISMHASPEAQDGAVVMLSENGAGRWLPFAGFVVIAFSAIRLAKFNNDARQSDSFIGLPTPANAMFICSLPLMVKATPNAASLFMHPVVLAALAIVVSFLLVCELPLFSLKFKDFRWGANRIRYIFLLFSLLLVAGFGVAGIPLTIVLYVLLSAVVRLFARRDAIVAEEERN